MSKIWALTKVMFKAGGAFAGTGGMRRANGRAKKNSPLSLVFVLLILLIAAASLTASYYSEMILAKNGNYMDDFAKVISLVGFIWTFAFTLNFTVSFFFLSTDNDTYLPLPIQPSHIFFARLFATLISAYLVQVVFLLPVFIAYDMIMGVTIFAIVNQFLLFTFNPLISLGLIFIVFLLIAKVFNIQKHRKMVSGIMFAMMFILFIGAGMSTSILGTTDLIDPTTSLPTAEGYQQLANNIAMIVKSTAFLDWFRNPFAFAMQGKDITSLGYAGIYILISIAFLAVSLLLAQLFYSSVIVGSDDKGSKHKSRGVDEEIKLEKPDKTPLRALISKERRTLWRSGIYFSQLILPIFIMVFITLATFVIIIISDSSTAGQSDNIIQTLRQVGGSLTTIDSGAVAFYGAAIAGFFGSTVLVSATAVSREGPNAYLMKVMPVSPQKQIYSKMFEGILLSSIVLGLIILAGIFILNFNWLYSIMLAIICFLNVVMINYAMVLIDLRRPMLHWTNEIIVTKQNLNTFLGMLVGWVDALIYIGLGTIVLLYAGRYSALYSIAIMVAVPVLVIYIFDHHVKKKGDLILSHIE